VLGAAGRVSTNRAPGAAGDQVQIAGHPAGELASDGQAEAEAAARIVVAATL
jgi:hypothetical protein